MWSRLHEVNNLFEYRIVNSFICEKFILINKGDYLISDSIDTIDKLYFNGVSTLASKRSGDSFIQERMKYNDNDRLWRLHSKLPTTVNARRSDLRRGREHLLINYRIL